MFSNKLSINPKNILIFSIFGIFPDFDATLIHRMTFHNIFIFIIPLLIFIFAKKKEITFIVGFYLLSHLILDLFNSGISMLYPFYHKIFFVNAEIISSYKIDSVMFVMNYGIRSGLVDEMNDSVNGYGIVSGENIGTAILLIFMILISFLRSKVRLLIKMS